MVILMEWVDPGTICLLGGWQSEMIIRYLRTTAKSFNKGLLDKMF